jgi:hypothetical protein
MKERIIQRDQRNTWALWLVASGYSDIFVPTFCDPVWIHVSDIDDW